jgi:hypothetical protein
MRTVLLVVPGERMNASDSGERLPPTSSDPLPTEFFGEHPLISGFPARDRLA